VIGHRGNRAFAPENTLQSFTEAVTLGVDAIECDLHLSADGVPVVMHDETLERTTDGTGAVRERTVWELRKLDAGARFTRDGGRTYPWRGRGVHVPTLEETLAALPAGLPLILEMKSVEVAAPALRVLARAAALERVLIGSFLDEALVPFAQAGVPVSGASEALARLYLPALFRRRRTSLPFQALCLPRTHRGLPLPIRGYVQLMRAAGGPTHVWTINDPAAARRLWAAGVNGIISDDPGAMLRERGTAA
jgi:glycerophosphoryl diester phosphodiesterase